MNHQQIGGLRIVVQPDTHRTLPAEVMPGVPWPPGFKAEIDAWMKGFFRPYNMVKDGEAWHDRINHVVHVNPRTFAQIKAATQQREG